MDPVFFMSSRPAYSTTLLVVCPTRREKDETLLYITSDASDGGLRLHGCLYLISPSLSDTAGCMRLNHKRPGEPDRT